MDAELLEVINKLTAVEIRREKLKEHLTQVNADVDYYQAELEGIKASMRAEQEELKAAFEKGGVAPDEEYPEYVDEDRLMYHTKETIMNHSTKARQLLGYESD